jgi:hypothetical protein
VGEQEAKALAGSEPRGGSQRTADGSRAIPALGATVTVSTHDEALTLALREIIARRIAEAEKRKQRKGKDHTVA